MTYPDPRQVQDAIAAARQLSAALDQNSARLEEVNEASEKRDDVLTEYGKRNRHMIAGAYIAGFVVVALVIAIGLVAIQADSASNRATTAAAQARAASSAIRQNRLVLVAACRAGNVTRAEQVALWEHLAAESVTPKTPPEKRKAIALLIAYVRHVFAPRDCVAIYGDHASPKPAPKGKHGR